MSAIPVGTTPATLRPRLVPVSPVPPQPVRPVNPVPPIPMPADRAVPTRLATPAPVRLQEPDPAQIAGAVVQAAVEVIRGRRPVAQLARWLSPELFDQLAADAEPPSTVTGPGVRIRRVRAIRVGASATEASVVVDDAGRLRAAAVRLEIHRGRWRATVLQLA